MEDYPRDQLEFESHFASEEACRDYLFALRWPEGFRCPRCGHERAWPVRKVWFECARCGRQTSVTAGTIFQDTRKPLRLWFRAMWTITTQKNGASALGLQRVLGLGSYQTAWPWMHKLRRAMVRPGRERLTGLVEVDETYWGAEEEGVIGRQTERKALIAVAAEERGTGLGRIRMQRVQNASAASLMPFVEESVEPGSVVVTDNWSGYDPLKKKDYQRRIISINNRASRPRSYCRGCTWRSRYSSAGCWARIRGRSATSIWTTISTSSCSASIGADHAVGASSSTALCSRPWRWSRRRTARSSPIGTLRRCEPNYKMLGSPESSGYPASITAENNGLTKLFLRSRQYENGGAKLDHRAANRSCFWAE